MAEAFTKRQDSSMDFPFGNCVKAVPIWNFGNRAYCAVTFRVAAFEVAFAELVLTTLSRCDPLVRAIEVLNWSEPMVYFATPST